MAARHSVLCVFDLFLTKTQSPKLSDKSYKTPRIEDNRVVSTSRTIDNNNLYTTCQLPQQCTEVINTAQPVTALYDVPVYTNDTYLQRWCRVLVAYYKM